MPSPVGPPSADSEVSGPALADQPPAHPIVSRLERSFALNRSQRILLAVLFGIVAISSAFRLMTDRVAIPDPQPPRGDRWADLADRIDPNTAEWTELAALPSLGEKRARAIVAKRESIRAAHPTAIAFKEPRDLFRVTGIGDAMVEQLKPFLKFDGTPPTQPAR